MILILLSLHPLLLLPLPHPYGDRLAQEFSEITLFQQKAKKGREEKGAGDKTFSKRQ